MPRTKDRDGIQKLGPQHYRVWWVEQATGKRRSHVVRDTQAVAKAYKTAIEDAQARREYVSPDSMTLGAWLDTWLDRREIMGGKRGSGRLSTQERYRQLLGGTVREHLGDIPLQSLTADDLERYYTWAVRTEITPRHTLVSGETVKKRHKILKLALGDAVKKRLLVYNPAEYADTPRTIEPQRQAFTLADTEVILAALHDHWLEVPVKIALRTGARLSEVLGLTWSSVSLPEKGEEGRGSLVIEAILAETAGRLEREPWAKTKHSIRRIYIDADLTETLRAHRKLQAETKLRLGVAWQGLDLVCAGWDGGMLRPSKVSGAFSSAVRVLEDAGTITTKGATFHALRHTHATWLSEQGVPMEIISRRLGHSRVQTTQDVYVHHGDRDDAAAEALEAMLGDTILQRDAHDMHTARAL